MLLHQSWTPEFLENLREEMQLASQNKKIKSQLYL